MKATAKFSLKDEHPIICSAIHAGKLITPECRDNLEINAEVKLREEDPYTDVLAEVSCNNIIANYSRFEVDFNRKRESSVYTHPEDSWGLRVRKDQPRKERIQSAYAKYDLFYNELYTNFKDLRHRFREVFIFDIHSYNHRRKGPDKEPADPKHNPDIIFGTGNMLPKWSGLIDKLQQHFSDVKIDGKFLDVKQNVKFDGGWFSRWLHYTFPDSVCCLSIEFKKIFMDEWTGKLDQEKFNILKKALKESFPIIEKYLKK